MKATELRGESDYVVTGASNVNLTLLRLCELGICKSARIKVRAVRGGVLLIELGGALLAVRMSACEGLIFAPI